MINDLALLSDLHELKDTRILEHIKERRESAVRDSKNAITDRDCNIAIGKVRELDDFIKDIETAYETAQKLRESQAKKGTNMQKSF